MGQNINLVSFLQILKDIKIEQNSLIYTPNPFFINFVKEELEKEGIESNPEEIDGRISNFLFSSFQKLDDRDKLLILFSYVILNNVLENLDTDEKEGLIKVISNSKSLKELHKEFKLLLNLDVMNINKSIIIKIMDFKIDTEYDKLKEQSRQMKIWLIKSVLLFTLGTLSLSILLYIIPYTHNLLFGDDIVAIGRKLSDIFRLVFLKTR